MKPNLAQQIELGTIKKGNEVGYQSPSLFIFHACEICGKERWVPYVRGLPRQVKCTHCAVHSPEVRKKMSDSHQGLTLSAVTRKRISVSIKKLSEFRKVKQRLERDIREYMELCPNLGKPSQQMIREWAEDKYKYHDNGSHNGWIKDLIEKATGDMKVRKNGHKSVFVLYEENNIPQNKLGDFIPGEMVGIGFDTD